MKGDLYKLFHKSVNMSPAEIRAWAKDRRAACYSFPSTRSRLPKLADLKAKPKSKWTAADYRYAARVINFNTRMQGAVTRLGCSDGRTIALRNWGRQPSCKLSKTPLCPKRHR